MSSVENYVPSWLPIEKPRQFLAAFGPGLLFAATIFGAGSMYILSTSGAQFGFTLLWTLPFALLTDLGMREMAGRLGAINQPLMGYIRDTIGAGPSKVLSVIVTFVMHFWAIGNYAVGGAALTYLTPLNNVYLGVVIVAGTGLGLVELRAYDRIETVIAVLIGTVFGIYLILALGLDLPLDRIATGFVPTLHPSFSYLALVAGLMGTTVYYPNFFIQSSMQHSKGWEDIKEYRRDNLVGVTLVVVLSMAVLIVAAATLDPHTPTLVSPGKPLSAIFGPWALIAFAIAVLLAAFSSGTGTLFGAGYLVPQAWDRQTDFGDRDFRRVVEILIIMATSFAILLVEFTDMTPVRLAIVMPAVNGVIGLPITALALYFANRKFFDHPRWMRVGFGVVVGLMILLALLTAQDLYSQVLHWL